MAWFAVGTWAETSCELIDFCMWRLCVVECVCVFSWKAITHEKQTVCVCVCAVTHHTEVSNEIAICQHSFLCQFEDMRRFREGQESHRAEVLLTAATKHCSPIASLLLGRYSNFSGPCVCDRYKYYIHPQ